MLKRSQTRYLFLYISNLKLLYAYGINSDAHKERWPLFTFTTIDCVQKYFDKYSFKVYDLKNGIPKHVDVDRAIVYNYIIQSGGNNVQTVWWKNDKEFYRIIVPEKRWYKSDVSIEHSIENIENERVIITVFKKILSEEKCL